MEVDGVDEKAANIDEENNEPEAADKPNLEENNSDQENDHNDQKKHHLLETDDYV